MLLRDDFYPVRMQLRGLEWSQHEALLAVFGQLLGDHLHMLIGRLHILLALGQNLGGVKTDSEPITSYTAQDIIYIYCAVWVVCQTPLPWFGNKRCIDHWQMAWQDAACRARCVQLYEVAGIWIGT